MEENKNTSVVLADFYSDRHFLLLIFTFLFIGIAAALGYWAIQERRIQPMPEAFASTVDGKLIQPTPLNVPGFSTPAIIEWAVSSISTSFTFNFINYEKVITDATVYYTKLGFQDYRRILIDSGIVNIVQRKKYVVSVTPTSAPIILKETLTPDNVYSWQMQFNIQVTYENARETLKQDWIITMLILRMPLSETPEGLGIAALIAREGRPTVI
jgi:intracellular multiplication protein IcmL